MTDDELQTLQAYAAQMGLLNQQPTVVDPSVDHFAQSLDPLQQYAQMMNPAPDGAAHLTLAGTIPSGTPDVGDITIDRGPPPPPPPGVRQPTSQVINGTINGKTPDQMTPTEYADYLEAQGAKPLRNDTGKWVAGGNSPNIDIPGPVGAAIGAVVNEPPPGQKPGAAEPIPPGTPPRAPVMFNSGGQVIPGGFVDGMRPDDRAMLTEGEEDRYKAIDDTDPDKIVGAYRAAMDKTTALRNQAFAQRAAILDAQTQADAAKAHQLQQAQMEADIAAKEAADEVRNSKINPEQFFQSRSTLQSIAMAIGVGLGALAQSGRGGTNVAWDMIQQSVAQDIDAQKANLANKQKVADNALSRAMAKTGDLNRAEQIVRLQQYEAADRRIDEYMALAGDEQQKAKLEELRQRLNAAKLDASGNYKMQTALLNAQTYPYQKPQVVGGGAGVTSPEALKGSFRVPDGKGGWEDYSVNDMSDRPELMDESTKLAVVSDLADQIAAITEKGRAQRALNPQDQAQLDSLSAQVVQYIKGTKDNSDADAQRLDKMKGDANAWLSDGNEILKRFVANKGNALRKRIIVAGATPIVRGNVRTPAGGVKPAAAYTTQSPDAGTMPKPIR